MKLIHFVPVNTKIRFMAARRIATIVSLVACVLSVGLFLGKGLNYGIDFTGGIMIEIRTPEPANIGALRTTLTGLNLGEVSLQEFGRDTDVLIRVQRQAGDADEQARAVEAVREALGTGIEYRRVEFVGPRVSAELVEAGITAVLFALGAMLFYIWLRFEWQFGVGAVVALAHDIILTIGMFSLLGLEFNLATIAAILTIAGYSINDTVVVYDRVRENLRKYKQMQLEELLNVSLNEVLSRTILTSFTTLLALLVLFFFGGQVIRDFSFAMIWGVVVGTYSSMWIAAPLLIHMKLRHGTFREDEDEGAERVTAPRP